MKANSQKQRCLALRYELAPYSVWFTCRIRSALHIRLGSPCSARLNAVCGEATPYTAIDGLLRSCAQRPLAVHKGPIHHTVARSSKKVL